MKRCPTCHRTFEDTFTFCLIDGSVLSAPFDSDQAKTPSREVPPTEIFFPAGERQQTEAQAVASLASEQTETATVSSPVLEPTMAAIVSPPPISLIPSREFPKTASPDKRANFSRRSILIAAAVFFAFLIGIWMFQSYFSNSFPFKTRLPLEKPSPTVAQTAALSGGQQVTWQEQGLSWLLPPGWSGGPYPRAEDWYFVASSSDQKATISVFVNSERGCSIETTLDAKTGNLRWGSYDDVKFIELDGLQGVQFSRKSIQQGPFIGWDSCRRTQSDPQNIRISLTAATPEDFRRHQDEFYGVLYSTKIAR